VEFPKNGREVAPCGSLTGAVILIAGWLKGASAPLWTPGEESVTKCRFSPDPPGLRSQLLWTRNFGMVIFPPVSLGGFERPQASPRRPISMVYISATERHMKISIVLCGLLAMIAGVCLVTADEPAKAPGAAAAKPRTESAAPQKSAPARVATTAGLNDHADRGPVHELGMRIVKAFNHRDAAAFAATFTVGGEYTDEKGTAFHGRHAIEAEFAALFAAHTDMKMQLDLDAPHLIAPGVATADGQTHFTHAGGEPVAGKCSIVCAKEGDQWLIASLREAETAAHPANHREQVAQLAWLIGDWINEGSTCRVHFTCRWDETQNYLIRDFSVHVAGEKSSSGTQRIGYDPLTDHLKAWIFDSAGGFSDGHFHRDGDRWILHLTGVTADGQMASGTNIFTRIDDHRIEWQALDFIVGGERMPDTGKITIVRKPPAPNSRAR
jgi:uncharacterized protein (TIGR02246 family)